MAMRHYFDKELEKLHHDIIKMGSLVEESIECTITALKKQDVDLARDIFANDDIIDEFEKKIEKTCLNLIARHQPLAKDLRTISTALKIITDMERIGDHSADIAEITIRLAKEKFVKPLVDIPKMAECAKLMVNKAIDSYVRQDIELAKKVCDSDDEVDDLFEKIKIELVSVMKSEPLSIDQIINFLFIAKYLERMADHATNIAEWVVFSVTGEHNHMQSHSLEDDKS